MRAVSHIALLKNNYYDIRCMEYSWSSPFKPIMDYGHIKNTFFR